VRPLKDTRECIGRISTRRLLDRSVQFKNEYRVLIEAIGRVSAGWLPEARRSVFGLAAERIRRHGGRQYDNELRRLLEALKVSISAAWDGGVLDSELCRVLLLQASGEPADVSHWNDEAIEFHRFELVRSGVLAAQETWNPSTEVVPKNLAVTELGRAQLRELNGVRGRSPRPVSVFISHSARDIELVKAFVSLIISAIHLDPVEIRASSVDGSRLAGGAELSTSVRRDVMQAAAFVAILTPISIQSTWVLFELGARWGAEKPMLPLVAGGLEPDSIAGPLGMINTLECKSPSQLHQALDELAALIGAERRSPAQYASQLDALLRIARDSGV